MMSYNINKTTQRYFSIPDLAKCDCSKALTTSIEIDTEVQRLSSRKLWQILKLNQVKGCELDAGFILEVKQELLARNDFNEGIAWKDPH